MPTKVPFFVCCAAKDEILTIDNLIRRQMVMVNWCSMCLRDGESVAHFVYSLSGR